MPLAVAKASSELMFAGGDVNLVPVTRWDDEPVGTGEVGEVTSRIFELLSEDATAGGGGSGGGVAGGGEEGDHYELDYGPSESSAGAL